MSIPPPPHATLIWSPLHQQYELHADGTCKQCFSPEDERAFCAWVEAHTSFAFVGQAGRLSLLKEARVRGSGYWYAYRKQGQRTRKGYLGPSSRVTFARLEEQAIKLNDESTVTPAHAASPGGTGEEQPSFALSSSRRERTAFFTRRDKASRTPQKAATVHPPAQNMLLLSTKLSPPRLPSFLVERSGSPLSRPALRSYDLTLISASAGSGKTTLLSTWSAAWRSVDAPQTSGRREREASKEAKQVMAWLSLDALDNDPTRFWSSVIAALRISLPVLGEQALALLHAPQTPPLSTILIALLNDIAPLERDLILLVDDYHLITEQTIQEGMRFVLDHLPKNLHLVLATRSDPDLALSRVRVRGQLLEIRDQDLRFTRQEVATFLVQGMGLHLSEEDVTLLHQRTGGWVAGLHLAALSARSREDLSAWVSHFGGSHRYLLDYVQQDILARLPDSLQNFLLQTSIVSRMNAALCQAVTASATREASQQMLEVVERANLLVIPLDDQRHWYRYHDLFREALQTRLQTSQPELLPFLHLRAARWYEMQGEWQEAIAHALAAADYAYAADLMERAAPPFWLRGEVRTVHGWTLALPDAVLRAHVRLALAAALRFIDAANLSQRLLHHDMAVQVEHTFTRLEGLLREQQRWAFSPAERTMIERRLSLLWAWIELSVINKRGDIEHLGQLAIEFETFPLDEEASWNMIPLSFSLWFYIPHLGRCATLIPRFWEAAQRLMEARDYQMAIRLKAMLALALTLDTQFQQARQHCLEGVALLRQIDGHAPWEGHLYYSLFIVSYACNQLAEASDWLQRMLAIAQSWQQVELLVRGQIYTVRLALAQGDLARATQALYQLEAVVEREGYAFHVPWLHAVRVQVWLAQGNLAEASSWAAHVQSALLEESWNPLRRWEALMLVRVLLAQQQNVLAAQQLERLRPHFDPPTDRQTRVEWLALQVVTLHRCRKREQALQVATRLLAITEPESYVRLDLDTGEPLMEEVLEIWLRARPDEVCQADMVPLSRSAVLRLLAVLEQGASRSTQERRLSSSLAKDVPQHTLLDPLSRQEQQVLRLLVAGQTYSEMAQVLVVSPNTIKTQVSSIYRKLGVSRRAEAIAVSQRLHLLYSGS